MDNFKLVSPPQVAAARVAWVKSLNEGTVNAAAASEYTFLGAPDGSGEQGVIIRAPLTKPVDLTQVGAASVTDAITTVNLIKHGDVIFNMIANGPLAFTLITPQGKEVTPANYNQSANLGYTIEYTQTTGYEPANESAQDYVNNADATQPRLLFTPLASDPAVNGVDLRIDGATDDFDLDFQNDLKWLKPIPLTPGDHKVELVKRGRILWCAA